jgi:hypothetical protein
MPILYGELTIIHSPEQISGWSFYLNSLFGNEYRINKQSKILATFDGEDTIYETDKLDKGDLTKYNYQYTYMNTQYDVKLFPRYFEKNGKPNTHPHTQMYFLETPKMVDDKLSIDFRKLFSTCQKRYQNKNIPSAYNFAYYCYSPIQKQVLGLLRIQSSEEMPRFLFAYDDDEFTKEEVLYLLNTMLTKEP